MDKFVKDLKENICVDFDLQEVKDIQEATQNMVKRFSDAIVNINPLFEVKALIACGSMAEGTRTWKVTGSSQQPVIESDFLAVLKSPSQDEITTIKHCHGFMQVIDENDRLKHCYNKFAGVEPENALQVESIANAFQTDLLISVKKICNCVDLDLTGNKRIEKGCNNCTESRKTGSLQLASKHEVGQDFMENCSLALKWTSKACSLKTQGFKKGLDHVIILVNVLPSFHLQNTNASGGGSPKTSDQKHDCFLVPKMCATNHQTCWKMSYCVHEIQMLQEASPEQKHAFMVVKFMIKCLFSEYHKDGSLPSTYKVKTVFLHHIRNCSTKLEVTQCVKQILDDLSESYANQTLPHSVSSLNLLAANKTENLPVHNTTWHRNRCKLISECFSFIRNIFDNIPVAASLNLQNGIRVLQFIGRTYHLAWRQTEIEPVYEVDREKLMCRIIEELANTGLYMNLQDTNCAGVIVKCACPNVHWTKKLNVWEYASVREMYAYHRFECPNPPGKSPGREENILLQAQMNCDFFSMAHEDQQEWLTKLAHTHSDNPDDIVAALKAVDMYSGDVKVKKTSHHTQTATWKKSQAAKQ